MKIKITKEELEDLYINQKITQVYIGNIYGVDRKTINYYMKKYEIPKRTISEAHLVDYNNKREVKLNENDIVEKIKNGELIQEVAKEYNVHRGTIRKILTSNGIESLQNGEAQRHRQSEFMKNNNPVPKGSYRDFGVVGKMIETKKLTRKELDLIIKNFNYYRYRASHIAYKHYNKTVPEGYHIDHIFSVKDGWINQVPLNIISHPNNLRLIPIKDNLKKNSKSNMTLEELYKITNY